MNLKERIQKADEHTSVVKKELEALVLEYNKVKESASANHILDIKDQLIALDYKIGNFTVRCRELHGRAEIEAKTAYNVAFIDEKQNYEDGKKPTDKISDIQARLASAGETIMSIQSEAVYRQYAHFQSVCSNYITQLSQRVKGLQQELINSNQSNQ